MKRIVRLTESALTKIIKRVINEMKEDGVRIPEAPDFYAIEENKDYGNGTTLLYTILGEKHKKGGMTVYLVIEDERGMFFKDSPLRETPIDSIEEGLMKAQKAYDRYMEEEPEREKGMEDYVKRKFGM